MAFLKSTNYWMSQLALLALWFLPSRLNGMACVLMAVVCASYCLGRGLDEFGKGGTLSGYKSPEFFVFLASLVAIWSKANAMDDIFLPLVSGVICMASYNIGRGLAKHYRSKISTVFNR